MSDRSGRPSWDEYFMQITFEVAKRSTCPRATVGAVIVRDKRILTTGYNGAPANFQGALHGVDVSHSTIYVTHQPGLVCAKMIINAGIERVVYAGTYPDEIARGFLEEAGVELTKFEWEDE
jgi:dCMP deaminase